MSDMDVTDNDNDLDDEDLPVLDIEHLKDRLQVGKAQSKSIGIAEKTVLSLKEVVDIGNKYQMGVVIESCVLRETALDLVDVSISIEDSTFQGKVDSREVVFNKELRFWDTTFESETDFSGSTFKEGMYFEDCTFEKGTDFSRVSFKKEIEFIRCRFMEDITFKDASFEGDVDFSGSAFRKNATFTAAFFKGEVDLTGSVFQGWMECAGSNLLDVKKDSFAHQPNYEQRVDRKKEPNIKPPLSHQINRVMDRPVSRRQILRSIFRFLPKKEEESD